MTRFLFALPLAAVFIYGAAIAAGNDAAPNDTAMKSASAAAAAFAKSVVLRGTLGDMKIQVNVHPAAGIDEGLEGEYFAFGSSQKILLAGEFEGDSISLEESENGTDVSGQWNGKREDDTIRGTWLSADGSVSKPFALTVVNAGANIAKARQPGAKPAPRAPQ